MQKIKFLESNLIYNVNLSFQDDRLICSFENKLNADAAPLGEGFVELNEHNDFVQSEYLSYKYVYRKMDDLTYILTTEENDIYVEPDPELGLENPDIIPVLSEEELLAYSKRNKINYSKNKLKSFLENNPLKSTCHNDTMGTYSVTEEKQTLMMSQYMSYQIEKMTNPEAKLTWNETGKSCEEWTEEEFITLILQIKNYVYPLVSYQQSIEEQINDCESMEALGNIIIDYSSAAAVVEES